MNDGGDCRTAPATPGLLNIKKTVEGEGKILYAAAKLFKITICVETFRVCLFVTWMADNNRKQKTDNRQ